MSTKWCQDQCTSCELHATLRCSISICLIFYITMLYISFNFLWLSNIFLKLSGVRSGGGGLVAKSCLTFATPWTVACQAPLSMGFSRQEYGVGCHFLLQGIFLTQEPNLGLLHCRQILYWLLEMASHSSSSAVL